MGADWLGRRWWHECLTSRVRPQIPFYQTCRRTPEQSRVYAKGHMQPWEKPFASTGRPQRAQMPPKSRVIVQVPYGYSPVVTARSRAVDSPHERIVLRRFLEAAELGWNAVVSEPHKAASEVRARCALRCRISFPTSQLRRWLRAAVGHCFTVK